MSEPSESGRHRRRIRRRVRVESSEADRAGRQWWRHLRQNAWRAVYWGGLMLAGAVILYLAFSRIDCTPRPPE